MSDLILPDAPEPSIGPDPVESPAPSVAEAPEATVEAPADPDMFPRSYVEELRKEAADNRVRARQYEEAFEGYDSETKEAFLQFARLQYAASQGDQEAISALEEFYADDEDDVEEVDVDDADRPLTRAEAEEMATRLAREEYQRLTNEREQHQMQVQMVANVRSTAESMGYEFGTPEYKMLLTFANEDDVISLDDPLAEADKRMTAWKQSFVAAHNGQKADQADNSIAAPVGGGSAPDLSTQAWQPGMSEAQQHAAVRRSITERFNAAKG